MAQCSCADTHGFAAPLVGQKSSCQVLVDLLSNLALALPDLAVNPAERMITVDLSDMSEFAAWSVKNVCQNEFTRQALAMLCGAGRTKVAVVQNRFVFQTCMARSRFPSSKLFERLQTQQWPCPLIRIGSTWQCASRWFRFNKVGHRLRVEMTGGNWARTSDVDSDMTTLAYGIKDA